MAICSEETYGRLYNITVKGTALTVCKIPFSVQDVYCHFNSPLLSYLSALLCTCTSNIQHPLILKREAFENSKHNLKSFGERLLVLSLLLSGIRCLLVCKIFPLHLSSKSSSRVSSLDMPFHKPRQTIPVTVAYVHVNMYINMYINGVC